VYILLVDCLSVRACGYILLIPVGFSPPLASFIVLFFCAAVSFMALTIWLYDATNCGLLHKLEIHFAYPQSVRSMFAQVKATTNSLIRKHSAVVYLTTNSIQFLDFNLISNNPL